MLDPDVAYEAGFAVAVVGTAVFVSAVDAYCDFRVFGAHIPAAGALCSVRTDYMVLYAIASVPIVSVTIVALAEVEGMG